MAKLTETTQACAVCQYWHRTDPYQPGADEDFAYGYRNECRRHAPVAAEKRSPGEIRALAVWPATRGSDACGDFDRAQEDR